MAKTKTDGMSKYDAVCATLRDGVTKPADGVAHAQQRYGVEMTSNQFSAHKSRAVFEKVVPAEPAEPAKQPEAAAPEPKAVATKAPKPATPKPEAKAAPEPASVPQPKPTPPASTASPADLARQVKQLVEKYGAGAVRDMTGVFEG